jgi:hypothetical protein
MNSLVLIQEILELVVDGKMMMKRKEERLNVHSNEEGHENR